MLELIDRLVRHATQVEVSHCRDSILRRQLQRRLLEMVRVHCMDEPALLRHLARGVMGMAANVLLPELRDAAQRVQAHAEGGNGMRARTRRSRPCARC